jgi:flagellar hook-basal body complex protein FliE
MDDEVYTISLAPNGTDLYVGGYFNEANDYNLNAPYVIKFTVDYDDIVAPVISEVTPVTTPTNDTTPSYTFTTSEAGTITYGGSCSSSTTSATIGSNTVTFNTLNSGTYSNCTITVTDAGSNVSNILTVSTFTIESGGAVAVVSLPIIPITQTPTETLKTEEKNTEVVNENTEPVDESNTESNTEEIIQTNMMNNSSESNSSNSNGSENTGFGSGIGSAISSIFTGSASETFTAITNVLGNTVESVSESVKVAKTVTKEVIETKTGDTVVKTVTAVGFAATATTTAMTAAFLNPISMGEIVMIPMRLWSLLLGFLGIRKKNRPWGTVYDSITKQPLDPAYVTLMDVETNEEVVSMITDLDGRYGFIVKPGVYNLVASKTNYSFPSKNLSGKESDELYSELYFGTQITVTQEGDVINKNIPLDPMNFDWNEFAKRDQNLNVYFKKKDLWLARISKVLFPIGFVLAFIALIVAPQPYNYGIAGLYVVALISKKILFRPKPKVRIKYLNGRPASFSIIRFMTDAGQEVAHKVADINGEVFCLITDGQYRMSIEIKNPDATYTKMVDNQVVTVKGGYYSDDIFV